LAADAPPRHVLGIFHGRQEAEVVVNPRGLRNVRELERVDAPAPSPAPAGAEHRP